MLSKATKAHNAATKESSTGRGIDRHFLGLRLLLREGETHPLLEDPLFAKSQEWVLSTSGLSAGDRFHGTGFGAVYPNGYGINCESCPGSGSLLPDLTPHPPRSCRPGWRQGHQIRHRV